MKILDAYIDIGEYIHSLVVKYPDETGEGYYTSYTNIHSTGMKPPPLDRNSLKGRQCLWILGKMVGMENLGDFPRD